MLNGGILVLVDALSTVAQVLLLAVVYLIWLLISVILIFALVLGHDVSDHSRFILDHLTIELLQRFKVLFQVHVLKALGGCEDKFLHFEGLAAKTKFEILESKHVAMLVP